MEIDEETLPSREACQELIEEFCHVTNTDEALAQFYLQDTQWKLQEAIDSFFEMQKDDSVIPIKNDLDDSDISVTFQSLLTKAATTEPPKTFRFMTWNLDGIEALNLKKRTKAVVKILELEKPDIVFFQETVPATYSLLEERLPQYKFIAGGTHNYFISTLLKKTTVYYDDHTILPFPGTAMGRNLLFVEAHIGDLKLRLLNTHLESTKEYSAERKSQLREALKLLTSGSTEHTSILAGDLNLRDKEAAEIYFPQGVFDLWQSLGARPECKYTWDLQRNTNKSMPGRVQPRLRFDRVYLYPGDPPKVRPDYFGLEGLNKVAGTQSFPSDHWAIMVHFSIKKEQETGSLSVAHAVGTSRPELSNISTREVILEDSEENPHSSSDTHSKKRKRNDSIIVLE